MKSKDLSKLFIRFTRFIKIIRFIKDSINSKEKKLLIFDVFMKEIDDIN